jgi:hypothetical protein
MVSIFFIKYSILPENILSKTKFYIKLFSLVIFPFDPENLSDGLIKISNT